MTEVVDFLAPADSMKTLFRLPYNTQGVSVALHKFRGTLLVDGALDELYSESGGPDGNERGPRREDDLQQHQYQQYQYHGRKAGTSSPKEQDQKQQQQERFRESTKASANTNSFNDRGSMHSLVGTAAKAPGSHNKGALLVPASFSAPPPPFHLPPLPREYPHLLHFQMHELSMTMGAELRVFR
eukprot:evm.model.NODE_9826_length_1716_cov_24.090910.1